MTDSNRNTVALSRGTLATCFLALALPGGALWAIHGKVATIEREVAIHAEQLKTYEEVRLAGYQRLASVEAKLDAAMRDTTDRLNRLETKIDALMRAVAYKKDNGDK